MIIVAARFLLKLLGNIVLSLNDSFRKINDHN